MRLIQNSIDNVKVTAVADTEKFVLKFIERIQICNGKRGSRNLDVKMAYYNMLNFLSIIVSLIISFNGY